MKLHKRKLNSKDAAKELSKQAMKKHGSPSESDDESQIPEKKMKKQNYSEDNGPRTRSKLQ